MKSLDTNIVARWLVRDVPQQAEQVDNLLSELRVAHVPDVVFFELEHLLRSYYMMTRDMVAEHYSVMIESRCFDFDKDLWAKLIKMYAGNGGLSLADCYLAVSVDNIGKGPLITFDKTLARKLPKLTQLV